ncbi:MAG: hypothetical protein ABJZ62_04590 [Hyphomicrobiales bacterium]
MDFEHRIALTLIGALIGFLLSQSINVLAFFRRPKFSINNRFSGIVSAYTGGDSTCEPAYQNLGFWIENTGYETALNTRIFISNIEVREVEEDSWEDLGFEFSELEKPIDIIPPGKSVLVTVGSITSQSKSLSLRLIFFGRDEIDQNLNADTFMKKQYRIEFVVLCDNKNSHLSQKVVFDLTDELFGAPHFWSEQS